MNGERLYSEVTVFLIVTKNSTYFVLYFHLPFPKLFFKIILRQLSDLTETFLKQFEKLTHVSFVC